MKFSNYKYRDAYKTLYVSAINYTEAKRRIESIIGGPAYDFRMTVEINGKFVPV